MVKLEELRPLTREDFSNFPPNLLGKVLDIMPQEEIFRITKDDWLSTQNVSLMQRIADITEGSVFTGKLTRQDFLSTHNVEVRRLLMELALDEMMNLLDLHILDDSGDPELGILYEYNPIGEEWIKILKVRNSSVEPDGTYKHYWLHPDPEVKTVEEARISLSGVGKTVEGNLSHA